METAQNLKITLPAALVSEENRLIDQISALTIMTDEAAKKARQVLLSLNMIINEKDQTIAGLTQQVNELAKEKETTK